jgi:hypothetical protein
MSEWEYDKIFFQPEEGLHKQEHITYYTRNGKMMKRTITRNFMGKTDYQDSVTTEVISNDT